MASVESAGPRDAVGGPPHPSFLVEDDFDADLGFLDALLQPHGTSRPAGHATGLDIEPKDERPANERTSPPGHAKPEPGSGSLASAGPCLHGEEGHEQPCSICAPAPRESEVASFMVVGAPGKRNGSKLLRVRLARSAQWCSADNRKETAKLAQQHGWHRLARALLHGRSTDLRKDDMLLLARLWGLRSWLWRRRGSLPDDPAPSSDSAGAGTSGGGGGPGGSSCGPAAIDRTAVTAPAAPAALAVAANAVPRLSALASEIVAGYLRMRGEFLPLITADPRQNFFTPDIGAAFRASATRTGATFVIALHQVQARTTCALLTLQMVGPAEEGGAALTAAGRDEAVAEAAAEAAKAVLFLEGVCSGFKAQRREFLKSAVGEPGSAREKWEQCLLGFNAGMQELLGSGAAVLAAALHGSPRCPEGHRQLLEAVNAVADAFFGFSCRMDGANRIRADWADEFAVLRERQQRSAGLAALPPPPAPEASAGAVTRQFICDSGAKAFPELADVLAASAAGQAAAVGATREGGGGS